MSIKPTGTPDWAYAATNLAEPIDAKKAVGWSIGEKPQSSYANWLEAKQSAWIRYLSYENIVLDDFCQGGGMTVTPYGTPTGLFPAWAVTGSGIMILQPASPGPAGVPGGLDGMGVLGIWGTGVSGSIIQQLSKEAGGPGQRDVLLEAIVSMKSRGGSGYFLEIGAQIGSVINSGVLTFGTTGPSANWFLNYGSYNGAPGYTAVDLGVNPYSPTMYQTLIAERKGATLTVEIDGVQRAAIGAGSSAFANMNNVQFYIRQQNFTGYAAVAIDKVRWGVRRS